MPTTIRRIIIDENGDARAIVSHDSQTFTAEVNLSGPELDALLALVKKKAPPATATEEQRNKARLDERRARQERRNAEREKARAADRVEADKRAAARRAATSPVG